MNTANYENRHFSDTINTIEENYYPAQFMSHWHNYIEIVLCNTLPDNKKKPTIQINLETYTLSEGDILFIWPGELHNISDNFSHSLSALQFHAGIITELPDFRPYQALFRRISHINAKERPDLAGTLGSFIRHMIETRRNPRPFGGIENLITLYEMFMCLSSHLNELVLKNINNSPEMSQTIDKIYSSCLYIQENCTEELTLEEVAKQAGFSPFYFSRIFKAATSYPFTEYLNLQRVKYAQVLLAESDLSVTEICYQSGFKSSSTFNRVFKRHRSIAPSEYRKYYSST